jgi:hypothetical protein
MYTPLKNYRLGNYSQLFVVIFKDDLHTGTYCIHLY